MRSRRYFLSRKYSELRKGKINVNVENDKTVVVAVAIGAGYQEDGSVTENEDNEIIEDVEEENVESVLQQVIDRLTSQVGLMKWTEIKESLCMLAKALGNLIKLDIDHENMASACNSFEAHSSVDPRIWFLNGCTGIGIHTQ